jgi:UDP-3-O-[3-hydroxymyristoyl] glucosamine N-acyltransferase
MELTLKTLASMVGGTVEGDENVVINNFAKIEEASEGCITFLANPKYTHYIYETHASAVLVSKAFTPEHRLSLSLIRVEDPYFALAELLKKLQSSNALPVGIEQPVHIGDGVELGSDVYVGAFAYIGKGVHLGNGVKIYPQSYIGDGCVIGDNSVIRAGVRVYENCIIGKRCIVHSGAVIGADGFGFAPTANGYDKIAQIGNVVLEDDTEVGANTTIDRATFGSTVVGRGTKLDNLIQVAHNVVIGHDNVIAAQTGVAGSTKIGDRNRIGGQVGFAGHISIGDDNEIGAQSGIPNKVGNNNRIIGYPAIDARRFAKNLVYINKLEELFKSKTK